MKDIDRIIDELSIEELVGQTLCPSISSNIADEEFENLVKKLRPGAIFVTSTTPERIKYFTDTINAITKLPVIIASDVEDGPHDPIQGEQTLPNQMAFGACDDVGLTERAGKVTAEICRRAGLHWGFNPVVDLNMNFRCPECNIRAISDKPEQVIKIAGAYLKGYRKNGMMASAIKHFPGQGIDERNSHLTNAENKLSKKEWMKTYGKVYKELFKQGVDSVMIGHSALPAFETEKDEFGYLPATVSKSLITGLLKEKLGFDGVVVSDAMCMVGTVSRVPLKHLAVRFLQAGGDVVLFAKPFDLDNILAAVKSGELSIERVKDAVRRIVKMKQTLHLFDADYFKDLKVSDDIADIAFAVAKKSIKVLRDFQGAIPTKFKKGSKVLLLNIVEPFFNKPPTGEEFKFLKEELEKNGIIVDSIDNADYRKVKEIKDGYDMIMINSILSSRNYHGSTMRPGWNSCMTMWDGYVLDHPKVIFTSFGDPYKIFDFPYMKTYLNAFSSHKESQIAVAKVILGQIKATGKNPVQFDGYFNREV